MNHQEIFILTIFYDPQRSTELRGRLRHIVSGQETTFKNSEELLGLLHRFTVKQKEAQNGKA